MEKSQAWFAAGSHAFVDLPSCGVLFLDNRRTSTRSDRVAVSIDASCDSVGMDTILLEDFLAVLEEGSFSRAADRRAVSQPAFSRRIGALEEWMGTPLFDRNTHTVRLTPAGERFRPAAESGQMSQPRRLLGRGTCSQHVGIDND